MATPLSEAQRRALESIRRTTPDYYGCKQVSPETMRYDTAERLVAAGYAEWTRGVYRGIHITESGRAALWDAEGR